MAGRENTFWLQPAEHVHTRRFWHSARNVAHNVGGQRVIADRAVGGDVEGSVAFCVPSLQRLDSDALGGNADIGVARSNEIVARLEPIDIEIVTRRDIVPFDDYGAVESARRGGPPHYDAGLIRMIAVGYFAILGSRGLISIGSSLDEELLLDITPALQILKGREKRIVVRWIARRDTRRDGAANRRRCTIGCAQNCR